MHIFVYDGELEPLDIFPELKYKSPHLRRGDEGDMYSATIYPVNACVHLLCSKLTFVWGGVHPMALRVLLAMCSEIGLGLGDLMRWRGIEPTVHPRLAPARQMPYDSEPPLQPCVLS